MIEHGLLVACCPKSRIREAEDLKKKLEGSDVLKYMLELPEFLLEIDDLSPENARSTMCGRMRQWVRARRGPGMSASAQTRRQGHPKPFSQTAVGKGHKVAWWREATQL